MVFPGRFSSGCLRCRQRKVKCDEGKPTCRRCYNYGKPCLGYTDEFHFRHSGQKPKSPTVPVTTAPVETTKAITVTTSPPKPQEKTPPKTTKRLPEPSTRRRSLAVIKQPTQSYDDMSLCYFVRRFVSPDEGDGFPGHFSFLPSFFDHHKDGGLVETATLSVAQLAAYNHLGNEELRTRSLRNYGRVIKGLQQSIQSDDQALDDSVIATILLLCTYKDFSGEGLGDPNEHASGLFYLLERRGPSQIGTRRGAELFLLALLRLQIYSFLHGDDTYTDPGAIATVIGIFDPLLRALAMMSKTLSLRHRLFQFIQSDIFQQIGSPSATSETSSDADQERLLLQECFDMLDGFNDWDCEAATYWQMTFEGRGVPTTLGEMGAGKMHYDAETACIMILVRSARLILLQSMLLYQTTLQTVEDEYSNYQAMWAQCVPVLESDVRKCVDDMLFCVPYALGDIDSSGMPSSMMYDGAAAIMIVHSIRLVTHCVYTTPAQGERADIILTRLNSAIGIRSAVGWLAADASEDQSNIFWKASPRMLESRLLDCRQDSLGVFKDAALLSP
ncbi:uncharacterized protein B0J16DRAFT_345810 [Fusarium flagelliforme]|uniref:uncharacterized protein n=1 Tax=Fusarium flagelliforme TaxID=2675880 RepID=UPI001E8EA763|nr:uncharacterized protein B0J16DRAFT_345810 [Fusarium flagelliforme]KAH7183447.1 hypothetical protein B0J16DRAFT_345810 [Fusarium flagelliforme]